jgi:cation transport ATPase
MKNIKNVLLVLWVVIAGFSAQAQEKKNKNAKYTFEVNGNCDQCQRRIQKAAFGVSGVKMANWDVDSHQLSLILNEEKASLLQVKQAIAKIGHDTDEVKASDANYDNLHSCCKYERVKK